jgi:hypothetical protein
MATAHQSDDYLEGENSNFARSLTAENRKDKQKRSEEKFRHT